MTQALCGRFPALGWILDPEDRTPADEHAMRAVCGACFVFAECDRYADELDITAGFWAGRERSTAQVTHEGEVA